MNATVLQKRANVAAQEQLLEHRHASAAANEHGDLVAWGKAQIFNDCLR